MDSKKLSFFLRLFLCLFLGTAVILQYLGNMESADAVSHFVSTTLTDDKEHGVRDNSPQMTDFNESHTPALKVVYSTHSSSLGFRRTDVAVEEHSGFDWQKRMDQAVDTGLFCNKADDTTTAKANKFDEMCKDCIYCSNDDKFKDKRGRARAGSAFLGAEMITFGDTKNENHTMSLEVCKFMAAALWAATDHYGGDSSYALLTVPNRCKSSDFEEQKGCMIALTKDEKAAYDHSSRGKDSIPWHTTPKTFENLAKDKTIVGKNPGGKPDQTKNIHCQRATQAIHIGLWAAHDESRYNSKTEKHGDTGNTNNTQVDHECTQNNFGDCATGSPEAYFKECGEVTTRAQLKELAKHNLDASSRRQRRQAAGANALGGYRHTVINGVGKTLLRMESLQHMCMTGNTKDTHRQEIAVTSGNYNKKDEQHMQYDDAFYALMALQTNAVSMLEHMHDMALSAINHLIELGQSANVQHQEQCENTAATIPQQERLLVQAIDAAKQFGYSDDMVGSLTGRNPKSSVGVQPDGAQMAFGHPAHYKTTGTSFNSYDGGYLGHEQLSIPSLQTMPTYYGQVVDDKCCKSQLMLSSWASVLSHVLVATFIFYIIASAVGKTKIGDSEPKCYQPRIWLYWLFVILLIGTTTVVWLRQVKMSHFRDMGDECFLGSGTSSSLRISHSPQSGADFGNTTDSGAHYTEERTEYDTGYTLNLGAAILFTVSLAFILFEAIYSLCTAETKTAWFSEPTLLDMKNVF